MEITLPHEPAITLGFPTLEPVASLLSIAHLFGSAKNRCGIYLLSFQSGLFYVGQAVEVVRRFSQHRRNHDDIVGFSFIPVKRMGLDTTEKALIYRAESLGLKITNAVHVTSIVGDTDLDLVVSTSDQEAWLRDLSYFDRADITTQKLSSPKPSKFAFPSISPSLRTTP